jgi:FKBP-type peptidyl-prolyl cis-trans isomerase (trigger factor)
MEDIAVTTSENCTILINEVVEQPTPPSTTCSITPLNQSFLQATITIPLASVTTLFHQAALMQQSCVQAYGFTRGEVPIEYIKNNFCENLLDHVKELLLKHEVIPFLHHTIRTHELLVTSSLVLVDIQLSLDKDTAFVFELTQVPIIIIENWKYYPFKAPKRKNYKDLDRQVESFLTHEKEQAAQHDPTQGIQLDDWVSFSLALVDHKQEIIPYHQPQQFWFKVSSQDGEGTLREAFINKQPHTVFFTNNQGLQEYFSSELESHYQFRIEIFDVIPHTYFCIDQFKSHFRLKTNKEVHQKLIEVFSFRNDVCLRRSIVEETLKLLLTKNPFTVPSHLVTRQEQIILDMVHENPDYNVYRVQKDFSHRIKELAQRQVRESILINQFAYYENISVSDYDLKSYLSFFNRARMKEFIYFDFPSHKVQGQEMPIPTEALKNYCLLEKTINHIIYHLTKK